MKSNQIKQAFESIQADSDLADRVLNTAAGEPLQRDVLAWQIAAAL